MQRSKTGFSGAQSVGGGQQRASARSWSSTPFVKALLWTEDGQMWPRAERARGDAGQSLTYNSISNQLDRLGGVQSHGEAGRGAAAGLCVHMNHRRTFVLMFSQGT